MFVVVFGPYGQTRLSKKCILAIRCARSPLVTDPVRRSERPVAPRPVGAPGRGPASGAAARHPLPPKEPLRCPYLPGLSGAQSFAKRSFEKLKRRSSRSSERASCPWRSGFCRASRSCSPVACVAGAVPSGSGDAASSGGDHAIVQRCRDCSSPSTQRFELKPC